MLNYDLGVFVGVSSLIWQVLFLILLCGIAFSEAGPSGLNSPAVDANGPALETGPSADRNSSELPAGSHDLNNGIDSNGLIDGNTSNDLNFTIDPNSPGLNTGSGLDINGPRPDLNSFDENHSQPDLNSASPGLNSSGESPADSNINNAPKAPPEINPVAEEPGLNLMRENAARLTREVMDLKLRIKTADEAEKPILKDELRLKARLALLQQVEIVLIQVQKIKDAGIDGEEIDGAIVFLKGQNFALSDENISDENLVAASQSLRQFWSEGKISIAKKAFEFSLLKLRESAASIKDFSIRLESLLPDAKKISGDADMLSPVILRLSEDSNALDAAGIILGSKEGELPGDAKKLEFYNKSGGFFSAAAKITAVDYGLMGYAYFSLKQLDSDGKISPEISDKLAAFSSGPLGLAELDSQLNSLVGG